MEDDAAPASFQPRGDSICFFVVSRTFWGRIRACLSVQKSGTLLYIWQSAIGPGKRSRYVLEILTPADPMCAMDHICLHLRQKVEHNGYGDVYSAHWWLNGFKILKPYLHFLQEVHAGRDL